MDHDEQNVFGCPLRNQRGDDGVHSFDAIVECLSPELRAAFEAERRERQTELDSYLTMHPYST